MGEKFGQHFLVDEDVLETMVHVVDAHGSHDTIVEVGPGKGVLTTQLAQLARRVIAAEIDQRFKPTLQTLTQQHPNVEIIWQDILRVDRAALGLRTGRYSIAANLPYDITSIFLRTFLTQPPYPSHMALLIQKEVAQRLVAQPGQLSILGLAVQAFCQPRLVCTVPREAFRPQPKVASAIVSLEHIRRTSPFRSEAHHQAFFRLVKAGFAQKRKLLSSNLKNIGLQPEAAWKKMGLRPTTRAQELSLEQWLELAQLLDR